MYDAVLFLQDTGENYWQADDFVQMGSVDGSSHATDIQSVWGQGVSNNQLWNWKVVIFM